jgi:hypothetical protein
LFIFLSIYHKIEGAKKKAKERERKKEEEHLSKIKLKQLHDVHFGIPFILFITFVGTWRWFLLYPLPPPPSPL